MKDFIDEYGRITAIFAAAAFILSLVVGLFTRNPFGVAFIRAILLAILFAAIGGGLKYTVKRYLPEFVSAGSAAPKAAEEAPETHAVDIVLPEETPSYDGEETAEPLAEAGGLEAEDAVELSEESSGEPSPAPPIGVEEPFEGEAESLGDEVADEPAESVGPGSQGFEGLDPAPKAGPDSASTAEGREMSGLDSLPDLADIGIAPTRRGPEPQPQAQSEPSRRPTAKKPEDAAWGFSGKEDPEALAKAIRTVIKRDERR